MNLNLETIPLQELLPRVIEVLRQPSANLSATFIVLAIVAILLLMAIVVAGIVITGPAKTKKQVVPEPEASPAAEVGTRTAAGGVRARGDSRLLRAGIILTVLMIVWVAMGATTSDRQVCDSCHPDSPHQMAVSIDPHVDVACVKCHEPGDGLDRVTFNVIGRVEHVVVGYMTPGSAREYGVPISSLECANCHREIRVGTLTNDVQGVRMSHEEPLLAGAECVDCHALDSGIVSSQTTGHDACLKCHGVGATSAECDTCHTADPAQAIRFSEPVAGELSKHQIPTPTCDGCHTEKSCDGCHGIRMPHSVKFKAYGHARPGVLDIWENGGRRCGGCHFPGNNPCSDCHGPFPSHGTTWKNDHKASSDARGACACHDNLRTGAASSRTLCVICHDPAYRADQ